MCKLVLGFVKTLVENYQVCNYWHIRGCNDNDVIITSLLYLEAD